jgi:UDP-GlcNAc:undecaprenyl-phosphate/decaprenyl-phosphate GlcNAc-1-phosphate transferase
VSTIAAGVAFPAAALALALLLRSPLARGLKRIPDSSRWRTAATPLLGGIAIYIGVVVGVSLAVAVGPLRAGEQLIGISAAATLVFVAGLVDDIWTLSARWKLAAQLGAAAIVLSTGTSVQIVHVHLIAIAIGVLWLVGMTNAFNLLDNMDGLAASLAAISAGFFAIAAAWYQPSRLVLVMSVALLAALVGFLPFNLRPGKRALSWMGDSGSQLIGFLLAALGLASAYTVASSTLVTLLLPVLVLAVPILDTTLVTVVRLLDGRSIAQGGRDHSSHRLVSLGISETGAVVLLAAISAALGGTSLAYETFGDGRLAAIGVLVTFALLVQFGSLLADVGRGPEHRRSFLGYTRKLAEVLTDGAVIGAAFLTAFLLRFNGLGTANQRHYFLLSLPAILFARYVALIALGLYSSVSRYVSSRDALRAMTAVAVSEIAAIGFVTLTQGQIGDFSRSVFVIDAFICSTALVMVRFAERAIFSGLDLTLRGEARRVLIVGAGRSGRSLLRELRETPGERVVGFVDDDPLLLGRRLNGVKVVGRVSELDEILEQTHPEAVLVTIPNAPRDVLDAVVRSCADDDVSCRFVRREFDLDPLEILGAADVTTTTLN